MTIFKVTIPETYAPRILKLRARRLRRETGDRSIATEQELFGLSIKDLLVDTLLRPFGKSFVRLSSHQRFLIIYP